MPAMKELVKGTDRYRHYINGEWIDSTTKQWIEVENPGHWRDHRLGAQRQRGRCRSSGDGGLSRPAGLGGACLRQAAASC